jgi:hypothetical protein
VIRALTLFLILTVPAMADCPNVTLPPRQYECVLPYNPIIHIVNYWVVDKACRAMGLNVVGRVEGCHQGRTIVIPQVDDTNVDLTCQRRIFAHEHGHACRWPADHPGAQF